MCYSGRKIRASHSTGFAQPLPSLDGLPLADRSPTGCLRGGGSETRPRESFVGCCNFTWVSKTAMFAACQRTSWLGYIRDTIPQGDLSAMRSFLPLIPFSGTCNTDQTLTPPPPRIPEFDVSRTGRDNDCGISSSPTLRVPDSTGLKLCPPGLGEFATLPQRALITS